MHHYTLWRRLPADAQDRLPDDSWILQQSCLAILKEQTNVAQAFPLFGLGGEVRRAHDQPAA